MTNRLLIIIDVPDDTAGVGLEGLKPARQVAEALLTSYYEYGLPGELVAAEWDPKRDVTAEH